MGHINRRKRRTSRFEAEWRDAGGTRRRKTFGTLREAKTHLKTVATSRAPNPRDLTVTQAGSAWIALCRARGLERSTIDAYERHFRIHIAPRLGQKKIIDLTAPMIEAFKTDLISVLSLELTHAVLASLKMSLTHAASHGWIPYNPAQPIRIRGHSRRQEKVIIPTPEQYRLIVAAATDPARLCFGEAFIRTMAGSGLRPSELRGLKDTALAIGKDLNTAPTITVTVRADQWNHLGPPKSAAARRTIPIGRDLAALLRRWLTVRPFTAAGYVFPTASGSPQNLSNITNRVWNPVLERAGFVRPDETERDVAGQPVMRPLFTLYALRHFYASTLIAIGTRAKTLQARMGHASITMTYDTYGHLWRDDDEEAREIEAFEARLALRERA
jgi:integrase